MKKILIAEDDKFLQEIVTERIKRAGFKSTSVSDGAEVMHELVAQQPDLLLLDVQLPNKNGIEILQEIRNTPSVAEIPIILFTNEDSDEVKAKAKEFNAHYFMKALTGGGELTDTITELLE
ncbi:MAG: DNA-binding response OmpR family regulator [Acidimicrobiales bacterium]|jgi:DNA-binding response OmpR family regulator